VLQVVVVSGLPIPAGHPVILQDLVDPNGTHARRPFALVILPTDYCAPSAVSKAKLIYAKCG
jgi:hypothetical protein